MSQILTDEERKTWWNATDWNLTLQERILQYSELLEKAIISKLNSAEPVAKIDHEAPYGIAFTSDGSMLKHGTYLFTHPPAPSANIEIQQVNIDKLTEECESLKTLCNQMAQALINSDARPYDSEKTLAE